MVQNYRDLTVWQKAMDLAVAVNEATRSFPKDQQYVLVSQLQRSAVSVPSNIAEGRGRHLVNDFYYHLNVAQGSLSELETQLILSARCGYINEVDMTKMLNLAEEVMKMLHGLKGSLKPEKAKTYNLTAKG